MAPETAFVENHFIKKNRIEQRAYQVNLAESVLKGGNSLVVAPTALGKTIVAVLVAAAVLEREKGKKILFLAPTKPLCQQHQKTMQELMRLRKEQIILLTGSIAVKKRAKQWEQALIVTATPQTIENDARNARISMQNVSLVIFDEAHRAVGDYAYVYIAKKFTQQNSKALILGLTASPGAEQEHINEVCNSLFIKNIEIKSLGDEDVMPYTHEIKIEWRTVELPMQFKEIKMLIERFMQKQIAVLNKFGLSRAKSSAGFNQKRLLEMQEKIRQQIKRYGFRQPSLFSAATAIAALMKANHAAMLLETQGIAALNSFIERTMEKSNEPKTSRAQRQFLASAEIKQAIELTKQLNEKGIRHPKQHVLEEILKQQFELFPESRVIVFNHYRDSIKRLAAELNKVSGIRAERFVGQATKGKDIGMSQKDQAEKISKLRSGEINCIVASSVHPDEFIIIRNDAENKIEIKKIGEFVDSFIPTEPSKSETAKITGYSVLSFDGTKTDFLPITHVHKHQRQSEIVETVFSSGFRAQVTTDHSFFTFDESSNLVPAAPRQNMFAKICLSTPNIQEQKTLDLAKELYQKLPLEFREKVFCSVSELNQPKMRVVSSDKKFLQSIAKESKYLAGISSDAGLDAKTTQIVCERLKAEARVSTMRKGKYCFVSIRPGGEEYLSFLNWLFKNCGYYKGKYRVSLEDVAKSDIKLEKFCNIFVEVCYGKIKLPRFLEINLALAELLGLYVAEGDARNTASTAGIHLAARKKGMQQRMARCVMEGLGITPSITQRGVDINSKLAYYLVKYVFCAGIGSYNKEVPSIVFTLPTEHKWRFLEGYTRGDGHITNKRIVLTTVSKKLVTGLIFLLRQLGIKKVTLQKSCKRSTFEICIMESVPFQEISVAGNKCYYDVSPIAQANKKSFSLMKNVFCSCNNGQKTRQTGSVHEHNCFDYIKKIVPVEKQPKFVYDVSVEKTQLFVGGQGLICLHNSVAEEGLDIPAVDLVIFYEPVPSEIRYIQRRGRTGRLAAGRAIILMAKGTRDEAFYWVSIKKEKRMHRILHRMKAEKAGAAAENEIRGGKAGAAAENEIRGGKAGAAAENEIRGGKAGAAAENEIRGGKAGAAEKESVTFAENEIEEGKAEHAAAEKHGKKQAEGIEAEKIIETEKEKAEYSAEKKTKAQKHAAATGKKEKQTTLHSFVDCAAQDSKIVVFADTREKESPVIQLLQEMDCSVLFKQLEVGDYIPAKDIAIERKTVADFLSSIVDGRLPQQLMSLTESYERPLVLVEGDVNELFESRNIHRNAVIGMLTSIALNYRVPLLFTDSARETAQYIYVIAKREQLGKGADLRLRIGRKGLTLQEQQRFVIESLPLIGPLTAKNLLQHFGSIKAIFNADEKEMQQVDNLGKEKAKRVKRLLEAKWGEK